MATRPTIDPSVAAAIMPALEAAEQITDQYVHLERYTDREKTGMHDIYISQLQTRGFDKITEYF